MEEIKKKIAECITNSLDTDISVDEIYNKIEIPKDKKNGDDKSWSFICSIFTQIWKFIILSFICLYIISLR